MRIEIEESGYRWIIERDDHGVRVQMRESAATTEAAEAMARVTRDVGIKLQGDRAGKMVGGAM